MKPHTYVTNEGFEERQFHDISTGQIVIVKPGMTVQAFNPHPADMHGGLVISHAPEPSKVAKAEEKPLKSKKPAKEGV